MGLLVILKVFVLFSKRLLKYIYYFYSRVNT